MTSTNPSIARARHLLSPVDRVASPWTTLMAAAVAACAAVLMAGVMVLGPGVDYSAAAPPASVVR